MVDNNINFKLIRGKTMDYTTIFNLIGGLGLFVFGMELMGDGLQKTAGDRLKSLLEILTNNRIMGILVGAGVTAIIQSSSATTVMVVGFVNAGLMSLAQATGVIMGANIGTTITAQLVAFKLTTVAPVIVGIGVVMYLFGKKKKVKNLGEVFLGFGILFMGMATMEGALKPLAKLPEMKQAFVSLSTNPVMAVLVGAVVTAIVQSSSASTGILLALASTGILTLDAALPILFGCNIGTCITALLASITANRTAKKAALIHITFNVLGTLIFVIFLNQVRDFIVILSEWTNTTGNIQRQVANTHTFFNVTNTLILAPFISYMIKFVNVIIPGDDSTEVMTLKYLDERIIETPSIAVGQTLKEVVRMGRVAIDNLDNSMNSFFNQNEALIKSVYEKEELINFLDREITAYLVKLSQASLSEDESELITSLFHTVNDLERIGDHSENIVELAQYRIDHDLKFSEYAIGELKHMYAMVQSSIKNAVDALESGSVENIMSVISTEKDIDDLEKKLRADHIERLNQGICIPASGTIFLDMISNLERAGDHANNVAQSANDRAKKDH